MRDVVDEFATAYEHEDAKALTRTLARDVTRVGVAPADRQRGRAAVADEYRGQFAANAVEGYRLSDVEVRGGAVGRAEGRFEVERAGARAFGGGIVFGVVRDRGRPRIGLIATRSDS